MESFVKRVLQRLRELLSRCRTYRIMWLFRSSSQEGEPANQCSTSQPVHLDVKAVRGNMEKLRGYHELAKVSPESSGHPCSASSHKMHVLWWWPHRLLSQLDVLSHGGPESLLNSMARYATSAFRKGC